jgi:hypothetical protein
MAAARRRLYDITKDLLKRGADPNAATVDGYTALMYAAIEGQVDIAAKLLETGADPNARTANGETALMLAARTAWQPMVNLLVGKGLLVDLYQIDDNGRTAADHAEQALRRATAPRSNASSEWRLECERKCLTLAAAAAWTDALLDDVPKTMTAAGVRLPEPVVGVVMDYLKRRRSSSS